MEILLKLFLTFLKIGLVSIGGGYAVIPSIHEEVVVKAGWIGEKVFADIITISQMTPGPLAVNTSTFVGLQIAGAAGAVVATVGCVFCGVAISLTLYRFFQKHKESVYIFETLNGLKAASLGLIGFTRKLLIPVRLAPYTSVNSWSPTKIVLCKPVPISSMAFL